MARLLCESNINWTASSWKTIDGTSFSDSIANTAAPSTTYGSSSNFTPGAITVEGIMIMMQRVLSNTGTISVELYDVGSAASVAGTEVTINVSDINFNFVSSVQNMGGWVYFKFGAPVTLSTNAHNLRMKSSVASTVSIQTTGGTNWSRALVTSTTAAPAASDNLYICGPFTTTSTPPFITCTYNSTASTAYASLDVGAFAKLQLENNASKAYRLDFVNNATFAVSINGEVIFGSSSSRIQSTSSMIINLPSTSAAGSNLLIKGAAKFFMYGASKTRISQLASDASAGATSLTTTTSTGWLNGDEIVLCNTIRSATPQHEKKTLTANASGTTLTIAALTHPHEGTSPVQAHLGNLTSNAKIYGSSATNTYNINVGIINGVTDVTCELDQVEMRYIGSNTGFRYGVDITGNSASSVTIKNCTFHDMNTNARAVYNSGAMASCEVDGNVIYGGSFGVMYNNVFSYSGTRSITNNLIVFQSSSAILLGGGATVKGNTFGSITGNIVNSSNNSYNFNTFDYTGFDNNIAYGGSGLGLTTNAAARRNTFKNLTTYRNNNRGISATTDNVYIGISSFGNTSGVLFNGRVQNCLFVDSSFQGGTGTIQTAGVEINAVGVSDVLFSNCTFGTVTQHTTADINISGAASVTNFNFVGCSFGSATLIGSLGNLDSKSSKFGFQKFNNTVGSNFTICRTFGRLDTDATIFDSSPYSAKLTPLSASVPVEHSIFKVNVANGQTATVSLKIRKSVVGDGAAYNGSAQPYIYVRANGAANSAFNNNLTVMTATNAANGSWETLTYTTPTINDNCALEFVLVAIGTAGWVNVDTVTVT